MIFFSSKNKIKDLTDEELVELSKVSDERAYAELVSRYEQNIYNLALRITGNEEDASDILQETFIQAFKKLDSFRGDSKFSTWIYRIGTNYALMKKRKDKRDMSISLDRPILTGKGDELPRQLTDDWTNTPFDILENKEVKEKLDKAISQLHPDYRLPLVLRDLNGLSNKEVSSILNISVPAVKSRVHRARLFLRESLGDYFHSKEADRHES